MAIESKAILHTKTGRGAAALATAVKALYAAGQSDYALEPVVLEDEAGQPVGRIQDGDAVVFCCRRGEREIQLTEAFTAHGYVHFPHEQFSQLDFVILTLYHDQFKDLPVAFAPARVQQPLGEIVSAAGLTQARISESEKFAHVTYFLNGGSDMPYPGEVDVCIPSPKGIPFDQIPELSLAEVSKQVIEHIQCKTDLIVANFANGDVIGHTSSQAAKVRCAEFVDQCLEKVLSAAWDAGYVTLISADHGNLEELLNESGAPHGSHTSNPVPLFILDPLSSSLPKPVDGSLAGIAPTLLHALGLYPPACWTGFDLASRHDFGTGRRALLVILDGWGLNPDDANNPIAMAHTPFWDRLWFTHSHSELMASGEAVGLKPGKPGNSEAGHMNIGAGRIILQDDVRLDRAMQDGSFYDNPAIRQAIEHVKERGTALHLIGLLAEKSSHGSIDYPLAVLKMAKAAGLQNVYLHMIFDGRSTEPGTAPQLLVKFEQMVEEIGIGQIVTGVGRGIALDRDHNYSKTQKAYDALVYGTGKRARQ